LPFDQTQQERALQAMAQWARTYAVATILGMERLTEAGRQIVAFIIDAQGQMQGYQTKNQLDPTEDQFYVPGNTRRLFEINGMKFGVVICHEGWRYPETVRWAAVWGAKIVSHPHHTGSDQDGVRLTQWGAASMPHYEKAMMLRSMENTIYFASVNYALRFQESATSLIAPVWSKSSNALFSQGLRFYHHPVLILHSTAVYPILTTNERQRLGWNDP
jgi:predicted amidohydrolase